MEFIDRVDPEIRKVLEMDIVPAIDFSIGIERIRSGLMNNRIPMPEVPDVSHKDLTVAGYADGDPDVLLRIYTPDEVKTDAGLYWIHGGGMVIGAYDDDEFNLKTWASKFGCTIVSVEYRLAPESPYPAPVNDCYAGLRWMHANAVELGIDPDRITVAGASAGGGLAAGTVLLARDVGEVPVYRQMLIFPMIDDRDANESHRAATHPKVWHRSANQYGWSAYLGNAVGGPDVPIYAAAARATVEDLRGLPPAHIDVGELDAFRDEDIEFAQKLMQAGVACDLLVTPGAFHASESYNPNAASSRRIVAARLDFLGRALADRKRFRDG